MKYPSNPSYFARNGKLGRVLLLRDISDLPLDADKTPDRLCKNKLNISNSLNLNTVKIESFLASFTLINDR